MNRILTAVALAILLPALAAAQAKPTAPIAQKLTLEFVSGSDLAVTLADKSVLQLGTGILEGDPVPAGATIKTGPSTSAELKLAPNGTIIKLSRSTTFTVANLAATNSDKNVFAIATGKLRAVAAKGGKYEVRTKSAIAGVRGTDFVVDVAEGAKSLLMVANGLVQFDKIDEAGAVLASIPVAAGQAADAFAALFEAFKYSAEQFAEQFDDLAFEGLNEAEVPQEEAAAEPVASPETQPAPAAPTEAPKEAPPAAEGKKDEAKSGMMAWLGDALGMELGSVSINGTTYSKAVIQPNFNLGKIKFGLYLPIIYTNDLFDPNSWYFPAGNNEWSFGREYWGKDDLKGALDSLQDLALKIKYFELGQQYVDPFFVKAGNLQGLTLGHGLIMRNYANDTEFPAIRRIGFNIGYEGSGGGFEALVNDLADPQIFGTRLVIRPIPGFKLGLGISAAMDIAPGTSLPTTTKVGDLMLLGTGLDLDLPIVSSSALGIRLFADGAAAMPYVRTAFNGVQTGLKYDLVMTKSGDFKNWGASSGIIGNVLFVDWRLEYRYFTGIFRPSLFDATYDRKRGQYALQYASYLDGSAALPIDQTPNVQGIYGEGGFKLLKDKLVFSIGYMWPWAVGQSLDDALVSSADEFHGKLIIRKGLIPFVDLAGSVSYERRNLAKAIADGTFKPFDNNTTFGGEFLVPIPKTPNLDIAIVFKTVPVRDVNGTIVYSTTGVPEIKPSVGIETRFHF